MADNSILNNSYVVGIGGRNLVLNTFGRVYVKVQDKYYEIDFKNGFGKDKSSKSNIIVVNTKLDLSSLPYPGDGNIILSKDGFIFYTEENEVKEFTINSDSIELVNPNIIGTVTIDSGNNSPFVVNSKTLVKNLNVEFLNGYNSNDFAKLNDNETISGQWMFDQNVYFGGKIYGEGAEFDLRTGKLVVKSLIVKDGLNAVSESYFEVDGNNHLYAKEGRGIYSDGFISCKGLDPLSFGTFGYATEAFVSQSIAELVGTAPETLDTLEEIANAISGNQGVLDVLTQSITNNTNAIAILNGYFTNGAANYAIQLKNSRYIWGQEFDGTSNVSGPMYNVGSINFSNGQILTPTASGHLHLNEGFVSDKFISCKGLDASAGQSGSGGITRANLFEILNSEPNEGESINLKYLDLTDYVLKTITLTAGDGLIGGGTLELNRTFTLGTPSKITSTTTNAVTSESHTHEIDQASTSVMGIVKLYDALDSDSTILALTAKQGKAIGTRVIALEDMWENKTTYLLAKSDRGIVSNSFISCKGLDVTSAQANVGITRSDLFDILQNDPNGEEFINLKYLDLTDYATINWVNTTFALKTALNNYVLKTTYNAAITEINNTKVNKSITLTAGDGLTGGGTLEENRTFTLGTPSTITVSSKNEVSTESHTHAIDKASTSVTGIVKLYDKLDSESVALALTANQGKQINSRLVLLEDMWENKDTYLLAKSDRGIVSNSFISCGGLDASAGQSGGTFDRGVLFDILSGDPQSGESINLGYLDLSAYDTELESINNEIDTISGYFTNGAANKVKAVLKFGNKSYNGSSEQTIIASDLGALTSHQTIYALTIKNSAGTTQLTYTPNNAAGSITLTKAMVGLGNVENTKLSTWVGTSKITTLGTITTGTWNGTAIANAYLANSSIKIAGTSVSLGSEITADTLKINLELGELAYVDSLNTDDVAEGTTNKYFTNARALEAITGAASTIKSNNLSVNRALISNASGKVAVSAVTSIELGYLDGVTSAIQTQFNDTNKKIDDFIDLFNQYFSLGDDVQVLKGLWTNYYLSAGGQNTEGGSGGGGITAFDIMFEGNTVDKYPLDNGKVVLPAYPTTLPASDVSAWAKAATKPTYTASEVGALSTSGGEMSGIITLSHTFSKPSYIIFKDNRIGGAGYSDTIIRVNDENNNRVGGIGLYGGSSGVSYYFLGHAGYNGDNLRIYSDKLSFGGNTLIHTGNYADTTDKRYLQLSGGTLTSASVPLIINRTFPDSHDYASIEYKTNGATVGILGFDVNGNGVISPNRATQSSYYTLIHSGNIGSYALKTDGTNNMTAGINWSGIANNADTLPTGLLMGRHINTSAPVLGYSYLSVLNASSGTYRFQLASNATANNILIFRGYNANTETWKDWKQIAFTDSNITGNAATATKLQNARTIWGQSFDGTNDIKGCLHITEDNIDSYTQGIRINQLGTQNVSSIWLGTINARGYDAGMWGITASNSGNLRFRGGATVVSDLMQITQSGNVGIGTTSTPKYKLDVNGSIGVLGPVVITGTEAAQSILTFTRTSANYIVAPSGATININVDGGATIGTSRLRISSSAVYKGENVTVNLGTQDNPWSNIYGVNGNFSGNISASGNIYLQDTTGTASTSHKLWFLRRTISDDYWDYGIYAQTSKGLTFVQSANGANTDIAWLDGYGNFNTIGNISATGAVTATSLKIGNGIIEWDEENHGFKVTGGLYTDSYLSAGGANTNTSGGSGGLTEFSIVVNGTSYDSVNGIATISEQLQPLITANNKLAYSLISGTPTIPTSLKSPHALTFGTKTYDGSEAKTITASDLGLGNVENTKLSTWAGTSKITTLGTITTGTWNGTKITNAYLANSSIKIAGTSVSLGNEITAATLKSNLELGSLAYKSSLAASDVPDLSGSYLSTGGGTMSGDICLDHYYSRMSRIIFKDNRIYENGYEDQILEIRDKNDSRVGAIGLYGNSVGVQYYYFGHKGYAGVNLRIYSDKLSFGDNTLYHTGNFNPANYLPLSGGTLQADSADLLVINRLSSTNTAYITFKGNNSLRGRIGFNSSNQPIVQDVSISSDNQLLIHSGNIGSYALKTDGTNNMTAGINWSGIANNADTLPTGLLMGRHISTSAPVLGCSYLSVLNASSGTYRFQLASNATANNILIFRGYNANTETWKDWKQIAFTDSNVASATKLSDNTAYTAWGQTFFENGKPKNVSGSILLSNATYIRSYLADKESTASLFGLNSDNALLIAYGLKTLGKTGIYGKEIYFAPNGELVKMYINSSGNVTIGSSDLAGTSAKLYVDGSVYVGNKKVLDRVSNNLHIGEGIRGSYDTSVFGTNILFNTFSANNAMMIALGGNVGIGTTAPQYKLDVNGQTRIVSSPFAGLVIHRQGSASTLGSAISLSTDYAQLGVMGWNQYNEFKLQDGEGNKFFYGGKDGVTIDAKLYAPQGASVDTLTITNQGAPAHIKFSRASLNYIDIPTNGGLAFTFGTQSQAGSTMYMYNGKVNVNGNIYLQDTTGTSSTSYKLWFLRRTTTDDYWDYGIYAQTSKGLTFVQNSEGTNTDIAWLDDYGNFNVIGNISSSGNISASGAVTAGVASDIRLKDNIQIIDPNKAIEVLMALNPIIFHWNDIAKELGGFEGISQGFIAQEYESIIPNSGRAIWGEYRAIDYTKAIPFMVSVEQNHEQRIKQLEEENKELKQELETIKKQYNYGIY